MRKGITLHILSLLILLSNISSQAYTYLKQNHVPFEHAKNERPHNTIKHLLTSVEIQNNKINDGDNDSSDENEDDESVSCKKYLKTSVYFSATYYSQKLQFLCQQIKRQRTLDTQSTYFTPQRHLVFGVLRI